MLTRTPKDSEETVKCSTEPLNIARRPKMVHGAPKHSTKTLKCSMETEMFHGDPQMIDGDP